jgi:broad specificity phosphatase PhoE
LFVLARHGQSQLNLERRVNGDPAVDVPLTETGRDEARLLGAQLAHLALDLCLHSRFPRARETAELAVAGRGVPVEVEALLDDVDVGELEGWEIGRYREVQHALGRRRPFPGGESLDDAALRYARGFRRLIERGARRVLVVSHEIPVRYALNAAAGAAALDVPPFHDIPNAVPYLFEDEALARAAERIEVLAGP